MNTPHLPAFTDWITTLARDHTAALARVARAEGLTADDALDAVQEAFETFLLLPQARALADAPEDTRALMSVIVRNAARNMRRRHHRARPHDAIEDRELVDQSPNADELLAHAEQHLMLLGCVSQLADIQRRILTMRVLEEVSGADVAAKLDLKPGHVAVLLHRAKRELMRCMTY